jgi:hypothetical protein
LKNWRYRTLADLADTTEDTEASMWEREIIENFERQMVKHDSHVRYLRRKAKRQS